MFPLRNKLTGRRNTTCNECHKIYLKGHYLRNKQKYIITSAKSAKKNRELNRQKLFDYLKDKKCKDCSENDIRVLDFDHRSGEKKEHGISKMMHLYTWTRILKEIEKCDIRCSNCHRKKTAVQLGWFKGSFFV